MMNYEKIFMRKISESLIMPVGKKREITGKNQFSGDYHNKMIIFFFENRKPVFLADPWPLPLLPLTLSRIDSNLG